MPVTLDGRHLWIISKRFVGLDENPVDKMQAIHVNLFISKVPVWIDSVELVSEIITNMMSKLLPKKARRCWIAMEKKDGKSDLRDEPSCI